MSNKLAKEPFVVHYSATKKFTDIDKAKKFAENNDGSVYVHCFLDGQWFYATDLDVINEINEVTE